MSVSCGKGLPAWLWLICQGFLYSPWGSIAPGFRFSSCQCWWISGASAFGIVPHYILFYLTHFHPLWHHSAAHGHDMEANMLQCLLTSPLSSSSRKWRHSFASQSQRRTPNSLKVNETYKRGAPAIHLNPQSNLLSQQRQTSPCAPSAVLGITNYGIFCPAYVLLCRHVRCDRLSYNGTCPI